MAHRLNEYFKGSPPIGIEVYPTSLWPFNVSPSRIREWQQEFPNAPVSRVHLEFEADYAEKMDRLSHGGVKQKLRSVALMSLFSTVMQRKGLRMARELGVGMNIHGNIGAYLERRNLWAEFKEGVPFTLIENGIRDTSFHHPEVNGLSDPAKLAETMVGEGKADGLLLGVDHLHEINAKPELDLHHIDPLDILEYKVVQDTLRAMHVTNNHHGIIIPGDKAYRRFFEKLAVTPLKHDELRIAFDYSPTALRKYSPDEQLTVMKATILCIMDIQKRAQAA